MIPVNRQPVGLGKTLNQALAALEKRLKKQGIPRVGTTWKYHRGEPDPQSLPNDPIGVWLRVVRIKADEDEAWTSQGFIAVWKMEIVIQDAGSDEYGFDQEYANRIVDDVIRTLYETKTDVSLDQTVEMTDNYDIQFDIGRPAGGDRQIGAWTVLFEARHPLISYATS